MTHTISDLQFGTYVRAVMTPVHGIHPPSFFNGRGFISGTILQEKRPAGGAIVNLVHTETNTLVRSTTTEVDGTFVFDKIAEGHEYHIIAIDPAGVWENKVSSKRYPRVTP